MYTFNNTVIKHCIRTNFKLPLKLTVYFRLSFLLATLCFILPLPPVFQGCSGISKTRLFVFLFFLVLRVANCETPSSPPVQSTLESHFIQRLLSLVFCSDSRHFCQADALNGNQQEVCRTQWQHTLLRCCVRHT